MITSATNNRMKRLVQLREKSKVRFEENVFLTEGIKMFEEAPNEWVREIYVSESFCHKENNQVLLKNRNFEMVSDEVFKKISDTVTPQGILCVLDRPSYNLEELLQKKNGLFLILEDIQDPGNLGTIMRTAEGAGVDGIFMSRETVDLFNPKTIRSSMGSIFRVPFFYEDSLKERIEYLKKKQITIYAAHLEGAVFYDTLDYKKGTAFLIGNEGQGLKKETADLADTAIKIPMCGKVESLNAAIAAALLTYEANRQRR